MMVHVFTEFVVEICPYIFQERLFPAIHLHWKKYQETLLQQIKNLGQPVTMAGDGRHDSMGQIWSIYYVLLHALQDSTLFTHSGTNISIIQFSLIQVQTCS